jgi:hypothetical protein
MVKNEYKKSCRRFLSFQQLLYIYSVGTFCVNRYIVPLKNYYKKVKEVPKMLEALWEEED